MTRLLAVMVGFCLVSASVHATPTNITVRVLSKDAKFIGSSMGGVRIQLRDMADGSLLAEGMTEGETGDTQRIMTDPWVREKALSTKDSANFTTTIDLERPTRVQLTAEGPASNPDSANIVSATQWVIPGKHVTGGDGWLLEMRGFSVTANATVKESAAIDSAVLTLKATITMMCGCPIEPGGMWDANGYEVAAVLTDVSGKATTVPLQYAGETSVFSGSAELKGNGPFEAVVYAYNPSNGNTGVDVVKFNGPQ